MHSNFNLTNFRGVPLKIYLHEYLTHEYFHTRKFPDLQSFIASNTVKNSKSGPAKTVPAGLPEPSLLYTCVNCTHLVHVQ